MPFEPENAPMLSGTTALTLTDVSGVAPPVIISGDATATVEWSIEGSLVSVLDPNTEFLVQVYLERIGPGSDLTFPTTGPVSVLLDSEPLVGITRSYSVDISIPDADVPNGAYTVTALITSLDATGAPASMAGFEEIGMRQWA